MRSELHQGFQGDSPEQHQMALSPANSTGRFVHATSEARSSNSAHRTRNGQVETSLQQELGALPAQQHQSQERDPLVPRQSSVVQKIKLNYDHAARAMHLSRSSQSGANQAEARFKHLASSTGSGKLGRAHAGSRNFQASSFDHAKNKGEGSAFSRAAINQQIRSVHDVSDWNDSRQERDTVLVQAESHCLSEAERRELISARARQFQEANRGSVFAASIDHEGDQDSRTIVAHLTPMANEADEAYHPENKSLSPNPGQRRYTNLLPNQMTATYESKVASQKVPRTENRNVEGPVLPFDSAAD